MGGILPYGNFRLVKSPGGLKYSRSGIRHPKADPTTPDSLMPQRCNRTDARRLPCGHITSQKCGAQQNGHSHHQRQRIVGLGAEQKGFDEPHRAERRRQTDGCASPTGNKRTGWRRSIGSPGGVQRRRRGKRRCSVPSCHPPTYSRPSHVSHDWGGSLWAPCCASSAMPGIRDGQPAARAAGSNP